MSITRLVPAAALVVGIVACESSTDVEADTDFIATLRGENERPAVTTSGTGTFTATLTAENSFTYSLSWSGLSGDAIMAHIHGPADANTNAGVLVDFSDLPAGSSNGSLTLGASGSAGGTLNLNLAVNAAVSGDSLRKLLDAGLLYVNVHTGNNPAGEIRGQIVKQ
jgi:hypothetical protein